jgi:hypothetical protein
VCGVPVRSFHYFGLFTPPTMPLMFGMGSVEGRLTVSLTIPYYTFLSFPYPYSYISTLIKDA